VKFNRTKVQQNLPLLVAGFTAVANSNLLTVAKHFIKNKSFTVCPNTLTIYISGQTVKKKPHLG